MVKISYSLMSGLPVLFCFFSMDCVIDVANLALGCGPVDVTLCGACLPLSPYLFRGRDLFKQREMD